nr:hypothetical protein [Nocardioides mangrovicus]
MSRWISWVISVFVCSSVSCSRNSRSDLASSKAAERFWAIITKVERKIASSDTTSVSVGHGLFSTTSIHTPNSTMCRYTNAIEPANLVIASATRFWMLSARRWANSTATGRCECEGFPGASAMAGA